jgi:arylsulfatase A-like enzyme
VLLFLPGDIRFSTFLSMVSNAVMIILQRLKRVTTMKWSHSDWCRANLMLSWATLFAIFFSYTKSEPFRAIPLALASSFGESAPADSQQPNIILINLDDADCDSVEYDFRFPGGEERFPNMNRLANEGLRFSNCHVAVPICGPSRACLLTGQFAFKTEIRCNSPGSPQSRGVGGGFNPYRDCGPFGSTDGPTYRNNDLGVWMQNAGYRTMLVGKYLHDGFEAQPGETFKAACPPGWDDFYPSMGGRYFGTYMFKNGKFGFLPDLDSNKYPVKYRTAVESIDAQNLVREHVAVERRPFFLYIAPFAPHNEDFAERSIDESEIDKGMVEPQYKSAWPGLKSPVSPAFNEADVSDKPEAIRNLPSLTNTGTDYNKNDQLKIDLYFRRRMLALRSVDDMVGKLLKTLEETKQLNNTIVIFTSDHGYQLGQQRHIGKAVPYDRVSRVPLYVWAPGRVSHQAESPGHLISHVDLAPTILEIAGSRIPDEVQGKSFLPLLNSTFEGKPNEWRPDGILVENWECIMRNGVQMRTSFESVQFFNSVYTEWANGDREYYELHSDPDQMENLYPQLDEEKRNELESKLRALKLGMPQPLCFMESPFASNEVYFQRLPLGGLAEFSDGIEEVRLIISDVTDRKHITFWTGGEWSPTRQTVTAELRNPNGVLTEWNYEFAPPLDEKRLFRVVARAVGKNGMVGRKPVFHDFAIDPELPKTQIVEPPPGVTIKPGNGNVIQGEPEDDKGNTVRSDGGP